MHIVRLGERTHHDGVLFFFPGHLLSLIGIEIGLANRRARGSIHSLGEEFTGFLGFLLGLVIELRMQKRIHIFSGHAQNGIFLGNQAFIEHIDRNLDRRLGRAFGIARLEHPQFAAFNRELNVLYIFIVFLQFRGNVHELAIGFGHLRHKMFNWVRVADTGHDIFALGIEQVFAHHLLFTSGWVAGKGYASARVIAHVAKDHGHDIDRGAKIIGNVGGLAVVNRFLAHPRFEHSLGRQFELLVHILREIIINVFLVDFLENADEGFPVFGIHFRIELIALARLVFGHRMLEHLIIETKDSGAKHFDQAAI